MSTDCCERVKAKLFAGILLTSEVRMYLNDSSAWKQAVIAAASGTDDLIEIKHLKKDYIGCYLAEDKVRLHELEKYMQFVTSKLEEYCPQLPKKAFRFRVFSQLLIN